MSGSLLFLAQELSTAALRGSPRLWLITRGAQPVAEHRAGLELAQATLCGVGKVIALEHPENWGGMIDLDRQPTSGDAATLVAELLAPLREDQIAFRAGRRFIARVASLSLRPASRHKWRRTASTSLSAGLARWIGDSPLARQPRCSSPGARRSEHPIGRGRESGDRPRAAGSEGLSRTADVADQDALRGIFDELDRDWPPLRGVVHAAGLPGSCPVAEMDRSTLDRMFAAKVAGSWNLHELTRDRNLDFFICFSSMVSIWGAKGQCHYVAANHFLDMLDAPPPVTWPAVPMRQLGSLDWRRDAAG